MVLCETLRLYPPAFRYIKLITRLLYKVVLFLTHGIQLPLDHWE